MAGKRKRIDPPKIDIGDHKLDVNAIPEYVVEDLCRVIYRGVREFFSNITPEQMADYERWKVEYHKKHPKEKEQRDENVSDQARH